MIVICLGGKLVGKPFLTCEDKKIFCDEEVSTYKVKPHDANVCITID